MSGENIALTAARFLRGGAITEIESIENGHINRTSRVTFTDAAGRKKVYILQAVNRYVFKQPELVMKNIAAVTEHLRAKIKAAGGDPERETITLVPSDDGRNYYIDSDGELWRAYVCIEGARTYETVQNPEHLYNAGLAFGRFQRMLADFPIDKLSDTIPDFHNTKKRLDAFFEAVERDECNRAAGVKEEIAFFEKRRDEAGRLVDMLERGELPLRVTHNDTKYNNIMIDDATGEALCVLDLDTVMPGLSLYDFGDAVRFAASTAEEDERDLKKVGLDIGLYSRFAAGFIGASSGFLTDTELKNMPWGAKIITMELASRFLADHINGDKYFRIHREGHNLDRARNQIKLALDMEQRFDEMCKIAESYIKA